MSVTGATVPQWPSAQQDRVEEHLVVDDIEQLGSVGVFLAPAHRPNWGMVVSDADVRNAVRAHRLNRFAVCQHLVPRHFEGAEAECFAGRKLADGVPQQGEHDGLVDGHPAGDAIIQTLRDDVRIIGEPVSDGAVLPAAGRFERFRRIPVEQRGAGLDALFQ